MKDLNESKTKKSVIKNSNYLDFAVRERERLFTIGLTPQDLKNLKDASGEVHSSEGERDNEQIL